MSGIAERCALLASARPSGLREGVIVTGGWPENSSHERAKPGTPGVGMPLQIDDGAARRAIQFRLDQLFSITPPLARQVFSSTSSQPWPLHEFDPLHPFLAVAQSLLPLHEFTPVQ